MRKLLSVIFVGWCAVVVYRGVATGLPASPRGGYEWGGVAAVGFCTMVVLLGALSLVQMLRNGQAQLGAGAALLAIVLAVAATAGMMRWYGRSASEECAAALDHMRALMAAGDRSGQRLARLDAQRPVMAERCRDGAAATRRCVLAARSLAELDACPP